LLNEKDKTHLMNFLNENSLIDSFDLAQKTIQVKLLDSKGANRTITVNIKKSIAENAKIAYEESKKFKDKLDGVKKAILQTNKRINTLQEKLRNEEAQLQQKETKSQRMLWFEKYRWFISSNGNLVIGGKDAKTNDQIVKKHLESTDRYVHADIHGAPSCIIKNKTHDGKPIEITQESISEACEFASSYSKAWKQFTESQAYWVLPEQVSKTPQSGEFVPKGAFIIRGRRNYCKCKLEIGIGLLQIDGGEKIIGGPTQAIEKWCKQYVTLRPDGTNKKILTKKLSKLFNISIDEVNKVLPPGDSAIVSIHGFTQLIP
jgi:predicted ribosome quality control (RQC) complex YloA/Tae2 family protein